jgi:protein Mpv17
MRIPIDNWSHYTTSLAEQPIFTKTMINVVIYLLGDWLSQTIFQGKNVLDFDLWRTLRNGYIGMCFGPMVVLYYHFSDTILPMDGSIINRVEKICMDQTIYLAVKCSIYLASVGMLQGEPFSTVSARVKDRLPTIMTTAWKFWPAVHCLTYSIIPAEHRMLWVNSVDLIWNAILASLSQKKAPEEPIVTAQEVIEFTVEETPMIVINFGTNHTDDEFRPMTGGNSTMASISP